MEEIPFCSECIHLDWLQDNDHMNPSASSYIKGCLLLNKCCYEITEGECSAAREKLKKIEQIENKGW